MFRVSLILFPTWILALVAGNIGQHRTDERERQLYQTGLDKHIPIYTIPRPSKEKSVDITPVKLSLGILKLVKYEDGVLTLDAWTTFHWTDYRWEWTPSDKHGLDHIVVPSSVIWTPDVILYNGALEQQSSSQDDQRAWIGSDGSVFFYPLKRINAYCGEDSNADEFNCTLIFGSWTEDINSVNLTKYSDEIDLESFIPNQKLQLISSEVSESTRKYTCCPTPFSEVRFTLSIRRATEKSTSQNDGNDGGTANQTTDAVAFYAYIENYLEDLSVGTVLKFSHVITNEGDSYNGTSGIFTCPQAGVYIFSWSIMAIFGKKSQVAFTVNGQEQGWAYVHAASSYYEETSKSATVRLQQGDQVWIKNRDNRGSFHQHHTTFSGNFISS